MKITNILKKLNEEEFVQYTPEIAGIQCIFEGLKNLVNISIGEWCTNDVLLVISNTLSSVRKIKVTGSSVDDEGL